MSVDKKFLIERQGKSVVLYQGLLDLAHTMGLQSIETKLVQTPTEDNYRTAIVIAKATMGEGKTFTGIGDAAPNNVTPMMLTCLIRMAETRAKARALRDATNCGVTAFEELGDDNTPEPAYERQDRTRTNLRVETQQRPPNVDQDGVAHEGVPSRPPLSTIQQAVKDFKAAAGAIDGVFAAPSFSELAAAAMVKCICEDEEATVEQVRKSVPSWEYATHILREFKHSHPACSASTALMSIQMTHNTKIPMAQFTGTMWQNPFPPAAVASNSSRIDAATMFGVPETAEAR